MTALDHEPDVIAMASRLGLTGEPVGAIIAFCQNQIDRWVADSGGVRSILELEQLVADRLGLTFEEVEDDSDLEALQRKYVAIGEIVFVHIVQNDLTPDTFGTMVRLKSGAHVAVIDCRGAKAARRFFTRWHEIAHLLVEPNCQQQVFRSTDAPLERLMDQIAGHVGFYDSLFSPLLEQQLPDDGLLTFEVVENIRDEFCPHASFQSTLFACQRRLKTPLLYVEAKMAYSESERRGLNQLRMFSDDTPEMKLRVQTTVANDAARTMKLTARWNMRVPESSTVYAAFSQDLADAAGEENLNTWTFSHGGSLMDCDVFVQARKLEQMVIATIQPK